MQQDVNCCNLDRSRQSKGTEKAKKNRKKNNNKVTQGIDIINITKFLGGPVNKILILVVSGFMSLSPFCSAESLTGVALEEVITLSPGGAELRLKGAATKSNARQAVYVGGLYLQNDAESVDEILNSTGAKRFVILTNQSIKADAIIRAINLGITVNHSELELEALSPFIKQFNQIWKTEIHQGDEVCIDFEPDQGTFISINGAQKGMIPGKLFYDAFLKTWLGDRPLNPSMKKQLLGDK